MTADTTAEAAGCVETLEELPIPAVYFAADGLVLEANAPYCRALGGERDRIVGVPVYDHVTPDIADEIRRAFDALTPDAPTGSGHMRIRTAAGEHRRRAWKITGYFTPAGLLSGVFAVFWDVTEDNRYSVALEELIRTTNNRSLSVDEILRRILGIGHTYYGMPVAAITRLGPDGVLPEVQIAPDGGAMPDGEIVPLELSYTTIAHAKRSIVAITDFEQTEYRHAPFRRHRPRRSLLCSEIYIDEGLYGALLFASDEPRATPFGNEDIQLIRIFVQWLSYALSRRQRIADLKSGDEKYRSLYRNTPIMMHTVGPNRCLTDANETWLRTMGYTRAEVIGTPIDHFLTPASRADLPDLDTVRATPLVNVPRNLQRKDGTVIECEVSTLAEGLDGSREVLAVLNDVTDRNRAQRSLTRLHDGLQRTHEGLKRFNAIAAHDLQEPLRKIRLFGGVLSAALKGSEDPDITEPLAIIQRSSDRLAKLVEDLLAFTRETERGYFRRALDLGPLIGKVLGELAPLIETSGGTVEVGPLPRVTGDAEPLERLFHNLLTNALTYRRADASPRVRVLCEADAEAVHIVIRDNGIGLPKGQNEKIFEPFGRLQPRAYSGTGIGLAIAKSIADGHGWTLSAGANPDGPGSDFRLRIPRADVTAEGAASAASAQS